MSNQDHSVILPRHVLERILASNTSPSASGTVENVNDAQDCPENDKISGDPSRF